MIIYQVHGCRNSAGGKSFNYFNGFLYFQFHHYLFLFPPFAQYKIRLPALWVVAANTKSEPWIINTVQCFMKAAEDRYGRHRFPMA